MLDTVHSVDRQFFADDQKTVLKRNQALLGIMWVAIVLSMSMMALGNPYDKSPQNMFLGAAIIVLALLPLSAWLMKRGRKPIPVLPMHGLFYAICYGVPGFVTSEHFITDFVSYEGDYTPALFGALMSWLMILAGYRFAKRWRPTLATEILQVDSPRLDRWAVLFVYPSSVLALLLIRELELESLLQIAITVRVFAFIWILHAAWSGRLPGIYRHLVLLLMLPIELIVFSGLGAGLLAGLLVYGQIIGAVFAATKGRVPVKIVVFVIIAFGLLTPIKNEYRVLTWDVNVQKLGPVEGLVMFSKFMLQHYVEQSVGPTFKENFDDAFVRINHLQTVAAVIADTPSIQPYRYGETLLPLLTKWIPRAMWPDKPREDLGNRWGRDYGYLGLDDYETSYNLPWLADMYMNFGWIGIGGISLCVGALMGALWSWFIAGSGGSARFAYGLTLASAFFFPESNLSMQIGGLIVSGVSMLVLMFALGGITRTRDSRLVAVRG